MMKPCPFCGSDPTKVPFTDHYGQCVANPPDQPNLRCSNCNRAVMHDLATQDYRCMCTGLSEEAVANGHLTPAQWWPASWFNLARPSQPTPPADDDTCEKCKRPMTVMGLNRAYPPKKDVLGQPICPHCGDKPGMRDEWGTLVYTCKGCGLSRDSRPVHDAGEKCLIGTSNSDVDTALIERAGAELLGYGDYDEYDHEYENDEEMDDDA